MRPRHFKNLLLSCLTTAALVGTTAMSSAAADYLSVTKDGVNLRSGPDTKYEVIYQLPQNYPLKVLSKKGKWIKIEDYEGDKGWIYETLVRPSSHVIVKVKEANVRSGPGTKETKVGTVAKDVILRVEQRQGKWVKVSHPQIKGWIFANLVWP